MHRGVRDANRAHHRNRLDYKKLEVLFGSSRITVSWAALVQGMVPFSALQSAYDLFSVQSNIEVAYCFELHLWKGCPMLHD